MAAQDRFRFSLEDEESEIPPPDEELRKRVSRLGRRVGFLTLLLPCLLAIALYAAYRDLLWKTSRSQSSEIQSTLQLAQDAEQQTKALDTRLADIESSLNARIDTLQQGLQPLREEIRKAEATREAAGAGKADQKALNEAVAHFDAGLQELRKTVQGLSQDVKSLAPFREELGSAAALRRDTDALGERVRKLESTMGKDLTDLAGYLERNKSDLEKIKSQLAALQTQKLDRQAMEEEVLKAKRLYEIALQVEIARIDKSIATLQRRLDQIEKPAAPRSATPKLPPLTGGGIQEKPLQ